MFEMFPRMRDCPDAKPVGVGIAYWFAYVFLLPTLLAYVVMANGITIKSYSIFGIVFWTINFLLVGLLFREYLIDSAFNIRIFPKNFIRALVIGLGVFALIQIPVHLCGFGFHQWWKMETQIITLPVADIPYGYENDRSVLTVLMGSQIVSTLCLITIVPVTMSCLYYGVGFAPLAVERPWLGYIVVVLMAAIPHYFNIGINDFPDFIKQYLCILPFHLCACWIYEQSDSIWGPIAFHAITNFIGCILFFGLTPVFQIIF